MTDIKKTYTNGELTIVWQPKVCIHSRKCFNGLPNVFDPAKKPWVDPQGASTKEIKKQIDMCPSGALSYVMNSDKVESEDSVQVENVVETIKNGPLMVYGNLQVKTHDGSVSNRSKVTAFCRCGASSNKPFCDGTHVKIGFEG